MILLYQESSQRLMIEVICMLITTISIEFVSAKKLAISIVFLNGLLKLLIAF